MVTTPIVTLSRLETAARKAPGSLADKPYAQFVIETASEVVCDTAEHPEWEEGAVAPPREAKRIALAIAVRALLNPEMETSWSTGPLSASNRKEYAYGFEPTPYELEQLEDMQGGPGGKTGLWVQPIEGGFEEVEQIYKEDPWRDQGSSLINYQDGDDVGTGYFEGS